MRGKEKGVKPCSLGAVVVRNQSTCRQSQHFPFKAPGHRHYGPDFACAETHRQDSERARAHTHTHTHTHPHTTAGFLPQPDRQCNCSMSNPLCWLSSARGRVQERVRERERERERGGVKRGLEVVNSDARLGGGKGNRI